MPYALSFGAVLALLFWVLIGPSTLRGIRRIGLLASVRPAAPPAAPRVSVLIPACNEQRHLKAALTSVLGQDYPSFEVICVNDRSIDATGAILERMARTHSRLRVLHVRKLPPGWLGKTHALYTAALAASGELLLFADADVYMQASSLSRAVAYLERERLDHLAVGPEVRMPGAVLSAFGSAFGLFFSLFARPWRVRDPNTREFVGIGAFNLVRAAVYRAVGTHRRIALRPDDDMKLGKIIKRGGYSQELLFGKGLVHVEWYASVRELIDGLMKNAFAGVDYHVSAVVGVSLVLLVCCVYPFVGLFMLPGSAQLACAGAVAIMLLAYREGGRYADAPAWHALAFPVMCLLLVYIMWRAMLIALLSGGICWRGTRYPLSALRGNRV